MSLYIDASAMLKLYLEEPESAVCEEIMVAVPAWLTGRHTVVEVRRNLSRLLDGQALAAARREFESDWRRTTIIELDATTCRHAAEIAEVTGVRSLDALHLGAARRIGSGLSFLTFDLRQAQAARSLGWTVLGA
ncbi:MAG: type II toxin-antitoxin system VapC family toxin [Actinomycetota bacterium]